MSSATTTTDHEQIRQWVEKRGGHPAVVAETRGKNGGGVLRIDFDEPGGDGDERLERIGWDEFFRIFDRNDLAFLRDEEGNSRFNKFVAKESAEG
jgi:hypothetical protein